MTFYTEGCFVCGEPLVYQEALQPYRCYICGKEFEANAACEQGHYICDGCHGQQGIIAITRLAMETESCNPTDIATTMMLNPSINMHGPEHHYLVPAALLSAYKNAGGKIDLEKALPLAWQRAKQVPGGICGMWGSCGASIGTGIFMSVITGATPLAGREWSLANALTSRSLALIAAHGGPRCCKRNTYLAIAAAVEYVAEVFGIALEKAEAVKCRFAHRNKQCRRQECLYFDPLVG